MSSAPAGGAHARRLARRLALPALLVVFAGLAVIYSLATPIFEGPDEIWHFAFASYLADGGGLPVLSATHPDLLLRNAAHPPLYFLPVAALIAPIDRGDFPQQFHFNLASPSITPGSHSDRPNLLIHGRNEDFPYQHTTLAVHLGRLWSIVLGVATLAGVWVVARQLLPPGDGWLALAATAIAAFIPQFVYGSAIINNDAFAAAGGAWTLAALLALTQRGRRQLRWALLSGLALGVTLLSKIGMVAIAPLPAAALLLANLDLLWPGQVARAEARQRVRWALWSGAILYAVAAAVAGWWYLRNWVLYGDPLAWQIWQVLAGVGRPTPTLGQFLSDMLGLFGTFWADFGLRVDHQWEWLFAILVLVALAGWVRRIVRKDWAGMDGRGLLLAAIVFGLLLASAVRYSLEITDIHGRLLYPALAAVAIGLVVGLAGWGQRLGKWLIGGVAAGLFVTTALVPFLVIGPAYARPVVTASQLPADMTASDQTFGGQVELVGYRLLTLRLKPGQSAHLVTYWRSVATGPLADLHANMALVEPNGQSLGHTEVLLGSSVYPSSAWSPNDVIEADFELAPAQTDLPAVAAIWLSVRGADLAPLPVGAASQFVLPDVALSAALPCAPAVATDADFGGLLRLAGYTLTNGRLTLCWLAEQPIPVDYTVFVHIVGADGQTLGNADGQPRAGLYPTSAWLTGETVSDVHPLALPAGASLRLGVYRLDTGERLSLAGSDQTELTISP